MSISLPRPKSLFGYDVVSTLGEGNAHHMYVVCHPETGQLHAMKHVVRKSEKDAELIEQMHLEFEVSKPFRSNFLRKCVDLKVNKKLLGGPTEAALIMELVDGEALDNLPPISPIESINIFTQVARGLSTLHGFRYAHCEVKPHHILVSSDGHVKVIDFGHVCKMGALGYHAPGMNEFISPEQVRCKAVSNLTDVYNLGATMYWVLTRHRVPSLLTVKEADWESLKDQPYPTPHQLNPQVPEPLSKLIMWCCQFSLGSRPADMNMVVAGLEKVAQAVAEKILETASPPPQLDAVPSPEIHPAKPRRAGVVSHPLDF